MLEEGRIQLDPLATPGFVHAKRLTFESADAAGRALEANRVNHIFTSDKALVARLHNHVVYLVLSLWALGASPSLINEHAERNVSCALPPPKFADEETVASYADLATLERTIGEEENYQDLIYFFEREIDAHGFDKVLDKYLLGDSKFARNIYPRLYHGYVHAFMHVGMGVEFQQATILAEGLAEAVVHNEPWYTEYFAACRAVADATPEPDRLSLIQAYEACVADPAIKGAMDWDLAAQFKPPEEGWEEGAAGGFVPPTEEPWRDRAWGRAGKNLAAITGRFTVKPGEDLQRAAAHIINTSIYVASCAQRPPHEFRIDFFIIHVVNASYWLQGFLARASVSRARKAEMIEDTGRLLTFMACGCGMPAMRPEVLANHAMKMHEGKGMSWDECFERVTHHADDGHMIKFVRALKNGERVSRPYAGAEDFPMRQDLFLKAANAVLDNATAQPMVFLRHFDIIRCVGLDQAWDEVPLQAKPIARAADKDKDTTPALAKQPSMARLRRRISTFVGLDQAEVPVPAIPVSQVEEKTPTLTKQRSMARLRRRVSTFFRPSAPVAAK